MQQALYLNNSGSRWVIPGSMEFYSFETDKTGTLVARKRTADYYESFGNLASVSFRVKGKKEKGLFDDMYRKDGLPVLNRTTHPGHLMGPFYESLGATL